MKRFFQGMASGLIAPPPRGIRQPSPKSQPALNFATNSSILEKA